MPTWWPLPWLALAGFSTALAIVRLPGPRRARPRRRAEVGRRADAAGRPARRAARRDRDARARARARSGRAADRARDGARDPRRSSSSRRDATEQAARADGRRRELRRGLVDLRLAGDRRGADHRGGRARRADAPLVLLPGLLAAGIGSLVFIGLGSWSGLSTAAWALSPFPLPPSGGPERGDFAWTILLAAVVSRRRVRRDGAGAPVEARRRHEAVRADDGGRSRGRRARDRLRGDDARARDGGALLGRDGLRRPVRLGGDDLRSRRWRCCCSSRDSPGASRWAASAAGRRSRRSSSASSAGLMAAHLPGYDQTQAVAALTGAACVATLRLPLASVMIASLLTRQGRPRRHAARDRRRRRSPTS